MNSRHRVKEEITELEMNIYQRNYDYSILIL